jgi:hypothetical protein
VATEAIDVDPAFLPPTVLGLPAATTVWSALGLGFLAVLLAGVAHHRAEQARPAERLRE